MAIGASLCEITATGATTNGGGFVIGASGVDYSQQDSPQYALTGLISAGAGDTILSAAAAADMVGNWACATSGTNINQGFYAVASVVVGVSITFTTNKAGTSIAAGIVANGVINIGGAFKLGATTSGRADDDFFEQAPNTGGNTYYIKGSHTTSGSISITATGAAALKNMFVGYNSTRTDTPTPQSGNQPTINYSTNGMSFGSHWEILNITFTGTSATGVTLSAIGRTNNCKFTNTSGTANRAALTLGNISAAVTNCDISSTAGYAIVQPNSNNVFINGNYIHDSVSGYRPSAAFGGYIAITNNIFDTISDTALNFSVGAYTGAAFIANNTLWNSSPAASSKGIDFAASTTAQVTLIANNISGWVTGINSSSVFGTFSSKNNLFNNTTNRTNWTAGLDDVALDPAFTDPSNGDFSPGTNLQRIGFPGTFPGGLSVSYNDIGAVRSNYTSWFTDNAVSKILTSNGNFKYNSLSNNRTPTYNDTNLIASNIRSDTAFGVGLTGTLVATPPPVRKTSDATSKLVRKTSEAS